MSSNKDLHEQEEKVPSGEDTPQDASPEAAAEDSSPVGDAGETGPREKKGKKEEKRQSSPQAEEKKQPSPEDQLKAEKDKYLRLLAEYDNYRKRSAKERENIYSDALTDTVTKFLPVYDNLVRALEQSTADEAYRRGVEMIMTQFNDILSKLGVTPIEALGQKFDPQLHNAVMHEEDSEKGENEIVQELQKGFKLGDKVIRFAMVKVAN